MTRGFAPGPPDATGLAREILDAVASGFADQIHFTEEMMRYPSLRGQEHTAQACFHDALASRGYDDGSLGHRCGEDREPPRLLAG